MKFLSRSDNTKRAVGSGSNGSGHEPDLYESVIMVRSKAIPAVTFAINRISFGRRMELSRRAREISKKAEFLEAGSQLEEKIEASILAQEVDAMYLAWGLVSIEGLMIDGEPATADRLLDRGPDELTREIVGAIKEQCGLSDVERKN
jgi:hypothetical protein